MSANRIQLDGDGWRLDEALAAEEIYPGHIIQKNSDGEYKKHDSEGDYGLVIVAAEDALQGNTIDDAYSADDLVQAHILQPGTRFQGMLKSGEDVSIGEALISDGEGRLIAKSSAASDGAVKKIMAYAEEAQDLTGSGASDTLTVCRAG